MQLHSVIMPRIKCSINVTLVKNSALFDAKTRLFLVDGLYLVSDLQRFEWKLIDKGDICVTF